MINAIETTQTPSDERRNTRSQYPGREIRLVGLRTHRMRTMTREIDRLTHALANKPGVMGRLEQVLANANEEIARAIENANKFANRPGASTKMWSRSSDSAELRSIEDGGNG